MYYQKRQQECMLGTIYKLYHVLFKVCVGQRVKLPWWCVILLFIPTEPMVHTDTAKLVYSHKMARQIKDGCVYSYQHLVAGMFTTYKVFLWQ